MTVAFLVTAKSGDPKYQPLFRHIMRDSFCPQKFASSITTTDKRRAVLASFGKSSCLSRAVQCWLRLHSSCLKWVGEIHSCKVEKEGEYVCKSSFSFFALSPLSRDGRSERQLQLVLAHKWIWRSGRGKLKRNERGCWANGKQKALPVSVGGKKKMQS